MFYLEFGTPDNLTFCTSHY